MIEKSEVKDFDPRYEEWKMKHTFSGFPPTTTQHQWRNKKDNIDSIRRVSKLLEDARERSIQKKTTKPLWKKITGAKGGNGTKGRPHKEQISLSSTPHEKYGFSEAGASSPRQNALKFMQNQNSKQDNKSSSSASASSSSGSASKKSSSKSVNSKNKSKFEDYNSA